jgi:hypothetical protein
MGGIVTGLGELPVIVVLIRLVVQRGLVERLKDSGLAKLAERLLRRREIGLGESIQDLVKLGSGHGD